MIDNQLQELYNDFLEFADRMCAEHGPMEVAAIMMTQSLAIYKSAMNQDDYNRMVDSISASRDKIKKFEKPTIQ